MEDFKLSRSAESISVPEEQREAYLNLLGPTLRAEIERRIAEDPMIGEGKAARVFSSTETRHPVPVCFKIWRSDVLDLRGKKPLEYAKIQYDTPEFEFELQDKLYMAGFRKIPRPMAFEKVGDWNVMAMEEFPGYTLQEIENAGARIGQPGWKALQDTVFEMNVRYRAVHRDLGKQNIFLKTDQELKEGSLLEGEIMLIDLGLSKRISGDATPEDYTLTMGRNVIKYPRDWDNVEKLKPYPGKPGIFAHL